MPPPLLHLSARACLRRRPSLSMLRLSVLLLMVMMVVVDVHANEICNQVTTCRRNGGAECDRRKETCPPCIYTLQDKFTCWEKDNGTNTCPFTGVKYDCSLVWASSSNSSKNAASASKNGTTTTTSTKTSGATTKPPIVMYAAIGGGALLVVILVVCFLLRRRRRGRNMPKFVTSDSPPTAFNTKRNGKNAPTANTPYANVPDTGKNGNAARQPYNYQRKHSDPVMLESSSVRVGASDFSGNTASDSLDGMLSDNTPPPAVLGDPMHRTRSVRGLSKGFKRINSGGSSHNHNARRESSNNYTDKITQDVSLRCTNSNNLLAEYLKAKHEMNYDTDAVTDYGSDTLSDRFSLASAATIGAGATYNGGGRHNGDRAISITDSEYHAELMRSRAESECYSEMSYNDEKYSFSEDDPDHVNVLGASAVRKLNKEIEI